MRGVGGVGFRMYSGASSRYPMRGGLSPLCRGGYFTAKTARNSMPLWPRLCSYFSRKNKDYVNLKFALTRSKVRLVFRCGSVGINGGAEGDELVSLSQANQWRNVQ